MKRNPKNEMGQYLSLLFKLGLTMVLSITFFFLLGLFLERIFHTRGFLLIVFVLLGVLSGMVFLYREIIKLGESDDNH